MTATSARLEAVTRLVAIAGGGWDPALIVARGATDVLYRKALRAAAGDPDLLDEVRDLWPVGQGRTEPLIDAALDGLPDRPVVSEPDWTVADLEEALS